MISKIKYATESKDKFSLYIILFIFEVIGVQAEYVPFNQLPSQKIDFLYANKSYPNKPVNGIFVPIGPPDTQSWKNTDLSQLVENQSLSFDLINTLKFYLSDKCHSHLENESYDTYERLIFSASFQGNTPIINIYLQNFKKILTQQMNLQTLSLWPENKKATFILSHDVDEPEKYSLTKLAYALLPSKKGLKNTLRHYKNYFAAVYYLIFTKKSKEYWLFEEILDSEKKYNFKSTFFFASIRKNKKWGNQYDVPYNIRTRKFKNVFKKIRKNGFEISLHASYQAYQNKTHFLYEKQLLSELSEGPVRGVRHHYWHLSRDYLTTIERQVEAGLEYDSSLAFNDHPGFRFHIALPFQLFNEQTDNLISSLQIPTFCMDGNIFYTKPNFNDAIAQIKHYINIIIDTEGVGAFDWHVRTSFPKSIEFWEWGLAYQETLKILAETPDVWVTNFESVLDWWGERRKKLDLDYHAINYSQ